MDGSALYRIGRWLRIARAGAAPKLLPLVLRAAALAAVVGIALASMRALPDVLDRLAAWVRLHEQHRTGEAAGKLFAELVRETPPALRFDPASGRIDLKIDCGAEDAGLSGPRSPSDQSRLRRLCRSDVGRAILNEIGVWNQTLDMLAVRDDGGARGVRFLADGRAARPADGRAACEDGRLQPALLPHGCFQNHWELSAGLQGDDSPLDAAMPGLPAGEIYGFLARPPHPGFGDWMRVNAQAVGNRPVTLSARIQPLAQAARITVDVIGDRPQLTVGGAPGPAPRLYCHGKRSHDDCAALLAAKPRTPHAWRFDVALPVGRELRLVLRSRAIPVLPVEISDLKDMEAHVRPPGQTNELREDESVALTRSIHLACQVYDHEEYEEGGIFRVVRKTPAAVRPGPSQRRFCEPVWKPFVATRPQPPGAVLINAIGGPRPLPLTAQEAPVEEGLPEASRPRRAMTVPTKEARELGLIPLVGTGESDTLSLLGQAVRAIPAGETRALDLTIDPDMQRLALAELIRALSPSGTNAAVFAPVPAADRRASIVIIDAGSPFGGDGGHDEQAGRILVAATLPNVPSGVSSWDLLAADAYRPSESPLAARAWSQNDRHYAPGSTFKAVVGLAAVDRAARGDRIFAQALGLDRGGQGGVLPSEMAAVFGRGYGFSFNSTELEVPIRDGQDPEEHEIRNADRGPLCSIAVPVPCAPNSRLGIRRAMAMSSNIWFARMALLLDESKVMDQPLSSLPRELRRRSDRELTMARILNRVWSNTGGIDLAPGFSQRLGKPPVRWSRVFATPIRIDAQLPDRPRRLSLALNGIGQATQATPLAMASLMASIATGRVVRPRLTPEAAAIPPEAGEAVRPGDMLLAPDAAGDGGPLDAGRAAELLVGLRGALHAVVEPGGTAGPAFANAPYRSRLHGKTGTAETGDSEKSTNSVWFVGWIDGVGGRFGQDRRLAFACVTTHMTRAAGGGRFCAPLIERILTQLHNVPLRQAEARP